MTPEERARECADRISSYLSNGGFFNPELMEHQKVRDLLIDCQRAFDIICETVAEKDDEIERLREALKYCADIPDHRSVWQMIRNAQDVARKALGEINE